MTRPVVLIVLGVLLSSFLAPQVSHGAITPIVLVPGVIGSRMEAKLNKTERKHVFCAEHTGWYTAWLSITSLLPELVDCFADNVLLHYDAATNTYHNTPGVQTRIPGFGGTDSIEYLDPHAEFLDFTAVFHNMVQYFVDNHNYVRGKTILGAPYDWRYAADSYLKQGYFANLKKLIETGYINGGNSSVVLVAHSMGAPTSLYFLTKYVDQPWKDQYIRSYVTLSGAWRGAAKALRGMVSGTNEGIIIDRDIWGRANQRSYPSTAWLFPYPSDTWPQQQVLVITPEANYTAWDYKALFTRLNYTRGYEMFETVRNLTSPMPAPNVTTYCYYGQDVDTNVQFIYKEGEFPDTQPKDVTGNGDGTVNLNSLLSCSRWQHEQKPKVYLRGFSGVEHVDMVRNMDVIKALEKIVFS